MHTGHGIGRRDAAQQRDGRGANRQQQRVQQVAEHAPVDDVLQVAPHPFCREHVLEVHVRGLRVAAEAGDHHHIVGVQYDHAQHDDEGDQQRPGQRMPRVAVGADHRAQPKPDQQRQRGQQWPQGTVAHAPHQLQDLIPRRSPVEETVQRMKQGLSARAGHAVRGQLDPAGEGKVAAHHEHGHQQQRHKPQASRAHAHAPLAEVQLRPVRVHRAHHARAQQRCRRQQAEDQGQQYPARRQRGAHEIPAGAAHRLAHLKGHHAGLFALGIGAFGDVLKELGDRARLFTVADGLGLHLGLHGLVLLIPHKGVAGFPGEHRDGKFPYGQAHRHQAKRRRQQRGDQGPTVHTQHGFRGVQPHHCSSFRMVTIM